MYDLDKFKGVFVALNAIYDKDDNVNLKAMKKLVNKGRKGRICLRLNRRRLFA
mgnify:CR=1 FL=1